MIRRFQDETAPSRAQKNEGLKQKRIDRLPLWFAWMSEQFAVGLSFRAVGTDGSTLRSRSGLFSDRIAKLHSLGFLLPTNARSMTVLHFLRCPKPLPGIRRRLGVVNIKPTGTAGFGLLSFYQGSISATYF